MRDILKNMSSLEMYDKNYHGRLIENKGKLPLSVFNCVNEYGDRVMKRDFQLYYMIIFEATRGCIENREWFYDTSVEDIDYLEKLMNASRISDLDKFLGRGEHSIRNFTNVIYGIKLGRDIHKKVKRTIRDNRGAMPNNTYDFFRRCKDENVVQDFIRWLIPSLDGYRGCISDGYHVDSEYKFDLESKTQLEMDFESDGSELSRYLLKCHD